MESNYKDILIKRKIKKVNRKYTSNIFSEKLKSNLTKNIFKYLDSQSKFQFAKTCIYALNNLIEKENSIVLNKLKELHDNFPLIEINYNEKDKELESDNLLELNSVFKFKDSKEEIEKYESPEMRKNYLKIEKGRKSFIALGNCFDWAWKDNKHHWIICKQNNLNYFNYNFWYLLDVCWVHSLLVFKNIPKGNYKLFLNMKFNMEEFKGQLKLIISYGKHIIYFIDEWPSEHEIKEFFVNKAQKEKEIKENFICVIKEEDFIREENEYPGVEKEGKEKYIKKDDEFYVEFWHNGGETKEGWYFGGARLEEIKKGELEEAIKEEDERKKTTGLKYDTAPPS